MTLLTILLCLQDAYEINMRPYKMMPELASVPQSGRITLEMRNSPAVDVCAELSKQAGIKIDWNGAKDATTSIQAKDAPLMHVLAEMCRNHECMMEEFQSGDGNYIQIPGTFEKTPMVKYQVQGPFLLIWQGLANLEEYNFKDPKNPIKKTRFALKIVLDPRCHARLTEKGARDFPVTFRIGGKELSVKSDHDPNVFSSSGPTWQFEPRAELAGNASLEVKLPYYLPTGTAQGEIALKKDEKAVSNSVEVSFESLKSEQKKDFMTDKEYTEHVATVKIIHVDAAKVEMEKAHLQGHAAWLVGADGTKVPAVLKSASGMSGPPMGYRYDIKVKSEPGFTPERVVISWAHSFKKVEVALKIDDVPLK